MSMLFLYTPHIFCMILLPTPNLLGLKSHFPTRIFYAILQKKSKEFM